MIFNMSWSSPYHGEVKTLRLKKDPFRHGLGVYEDEDGNRWDIRRLDGRGERRYVTARMVSRHPDYYSTAVGQGGGVGTQAGPDLIHTWKPYYVEV